MLKESQKLHYVVTEVQGPSITVEFSDCKASLQLPMEKVKWGSGEAPMRYLNKYCSEKTDLNIQYYMHEHMMKEGALTQPGNLHGALLGDLHNARGLVECYTGI